MGSSARESSSAGAAAVAAPAALLERFQREGWTGALGLSFESATSERVAASWSVSERHLQPLGLVHGGVYSSVVETCCSIGAALAAPDGKHVVGMENHTSFLRAVRQGCLRAVAVPLQVGRRAQLWQCEVLDESGRRVAIGQVRLMCVEPSAATVDGGERSGDPK